MRLAHEYHVPLAAIRLELGEAGDRGLAGAVEGGEKTALAGDGVIGVAIVDRGKQRRYPRVILPLLDADCALGRGRNKFLWVQNLGRHILHA